MLELRLHGSYVKCLTSIMMVGVIVREPAILLIKWLRPQGLNVCSYVEKYADFKNQTLN